MIDGLDQTPNEPKKRPVSRPIKQVQDTQEFNTDSINTTLPIDDEPLMSLQDFMKTGEFKRIVREASNSTGSSVLDTTSAIVSGILGTASDTGIHAINAVENFVNNMTDTLANTVKGVNMTVCGLGKDVVRTVTLGKSGGTVEEE